MAIQKRQRYTYHEWIEFCENTMDSRSELIDGELYMMASASARHQAVLGAMSARLHNYLRGKRCKTYFMLDVRLEKNTVLVPDLIVVCDPRRLTNHGCNGAPDFVVEILSPSTASIDRHTKYKLYQQAGVPEYWMVDPVNNIVTVCRLVNGNYLSTILTETDTATITALPGFELNLSEVFTAE